MKRNKLVKRMSFVLDYLNGLDVNTIVSVLERGTEPLKSFVDNEGYWVGEYYDTFEYFYCSFCLLDNNKIDEYENQAIYARMEYEVDDKYQYESHIDMIIYFKKDKTVEIVGMDYYIGADFYYKIEGKFKEKFDLALKDFMKDYHLFNK